MLNLLETIRLLTAHAHEIEELESAIAEKLRIMTRLLADRDAKITEQGRKIQELEAVQNKLAGIVVNNNMMRLCTCSKYDGRDKQFVIDQARRECGIKDATND